MLIKLQITDITCGACVKLCESALKGLPGVMSVEVENNGQATIEAGRDIGLAEINQALAEVGKYATII